MKRMNSLLSNSLLISFSILTVAGSLLILVLHARFPSQMQSPDVWNGTESGPVGGGGSGDGGEPSTLQQQWYADRFWHSPNTFPLCSMDSCFNFSRCGDKHHFLIYAYPSPFELEWYFKVLIGSKWHTTDPGQACVFLIAEPQHAGRHRRRPHPSELPHWDSGLNNVIISLADKWSLTAPPPHTIANASVLSSSLQLTTYRPGFDISIPLPAKVRLHHLQQVKALDRRYFLTFRGVRYLGNTEGNFRSDPALRAMHNGEDVVIAMTCNQVTNNLIRKKDPTAGEGCEEDQEVFKRYGFKELMNSTFGLAPAGRSPASYRMLETMSAGSIPVLIVDNYVLPFDTIIPWHRCLLQFPTTELGRILPALRGMSKQEIESRQAYCLSIYNTYLKDDETLLNTIVTALKQRFYGMFSQFNREEELLLQSAAGAPTVL